MSVNLCAQEGEEPRDVVLHFDVRFHRDNIISLSRKNGVWIGSGNYDTNYNMFVPGTIFRIVFEVKATDVITIYCQGKFHSNFLPKIPLTMAKFLVAWADVERITNCYFHMDIKPLPMPCAGDEKQPPAAPHRSLQRSTVANAIPRDNRRCYRTRRKTSPPAESTNVSSDENERRPKTEGRANRYFYDSLMCPALDRHNRVNSPDTTKYRCVPSDTRREGSCSRSRPEHSRKYTTRPEDSDTEKNYSDGYTDETVVSKNSTNGDSDSHLSLKKFNRRGSRNPFVQVASFMGKTTKRNN